VPKPCKLLHGPSPGSAWVTRPRAKPCKFLHGPSAGSAWSPPWHQVRLLRLPGQHLMAFCELPVRVCLCVQALEPYYDQFDPDFVGLRTTFREVWACTNAYTCTLIFLLDADMGGQKGTAPSSANQCSYSVSSLFIRSQFTARGPDPSRSPRMKLCLGRWLCAVHMRSRALCMPWCAFVRCADTAVHAPFLAW